MTVKSAATPVAGSLILLEQHTASASATLDFTAFISSTYDEYRIEGVELIVATNGADLRLQVGSGAGPTWDATVGNYEHVRMGLMTGGSTRFDSASTTAIPRVFKSMSTTAGYGFGSFSFTASSLQSTSLRKTIQGTFQYVDTVPESIYGTWGMQWLTTGTAATGLRFSASSGNITSGTIRIYGIAK